MAYEAYDLTPEGDLVPSSQRWAQLFLLAGFFLSLLIGLGALAGLYWLEGRDAPEVASDPLHALQPADIPPHLALLQLAGAPSEALTRQAINAGELELAYAIVNLDIRLSSSQRSGLLLLLGRRFHQAGQTERAALVYGLARSVAVLATDLPPLERSQVLVQSAEGLLRAGDDEAALDAAVQALRVAARSPGLLPAQRSQIWRSLASLVRQLDTAGGTMATAARSAAQRLADLQRGPVLSPQGVSPASRWTELSRPAPMEQALSDVVAGRQQVAQILADRILRTGGLDIDPEREALARALLAEDLVRTEYYRQQRTTGPALDQQHWLAQEQRAWLMLKLRAALGGFGMRMVPDWEADPEAIVQELDSVTTDLIAVLNAQVNAQVDPTARAVLQVEMLRWLALQSVLGFYPRASLADLGDQLRMVQRSLDDMGSPLALPVLYEPGLTPSGFHIVEEGSP